MVALITSESMVTPSPLAPNRVTSNTRPRPLVSGGGSGGPGGFAKAAPPAKGRAAPAAPAAPHVTMRRRLNDMRPHLPSASPGADRCRCQLARRIAWAHGGLLAGRNLKES